MLEVNLAPPVEENLNDSPLILVADDDRVTRACLRQAMEQEGYRVVEAHDGESCLATFSQLHPDVVLLDAVMPVMDGFTCCMNLKNIEGGGRTPVLIITALEDADSVNQAFEAGAVDYVTKPIHWAVLFQRVRHVINQVRLYEELEKANQELRRLATSDGLTQVANRRHFDEYLQQEWQRMQREKAPLSLILCDIDFFKAFNDTYGHQAGDDCLRQVAAALQQAAKRSMDLAARYGGEEFAIILPNTDMEGAEQVAQEIHDLIQDLAIAHRKSRVGEIITVSMGVATTVPVPFIAPQMLIEAADRALYQAKDEGRNCYRTFDLP
jgi:diguanylate cyclase (GGDEF)-like protein